MYELTESKLVHQESNLIHNNRKACSAGRKRRSEEMVVFHGEARPPIPLRFRLLLSPTPRRHWVRIGTQTFPSLSRFSL